MRICFLSPLGAAVAIARTLILAAGRNPEAERGADPVLAGADRHLAAVRLGDVADQRQPDSGAANRLEPHGARAVEAVEHGAALVLGHPRPAVAHLQLDAVAAPAQRHVEPLALRR